MRADNYPSGLIEEAQRAYSGKDYELAAELIEEVRAEVGVAGLPNAGLELLINVRLLLQDHKGFAKVLSMMSVPQKQEFSSALAYHKALVGDTEAAIRILKATNEEKYVEHRMLAEAFIAERSGDFKESLEIRRNLISMHPGRSGYVIQSGLALWGMGKRSDAEMQFRAACEMAPDDPYALSNLAIFLMGSKRIPEARGLVARSNELNSNLLAVKQASAMLMLRDRRYRDALEICRNVHPSAANPEIVALEARALFGLKEVDRALGLAMQNLEDHPRNAAACRTYFDCVWRRRPISAIRVFLKFCLTGAGV